MDIQKNDRIKWLIDHLYRKFGSDSLILKDFWSADLEATGFANPAETKLIYVAAKEESEHYYVALERGEINTDEYEPVFDQDGVNLNELEAIFKEHLLDVKQN